MNTIPPIIQVGDVLLSSEILTEKFCCDLSVCKGECCVEGDAGAPVTMEEIAEIEESVDTVWDDLSASAQAVIDKQGVAYTDKEGDLVTSIVGGKDCVFTSSLLAVLYILFAKRNLAMVWLDLTTTVGVYARWLSLKAYRRISYFISFFAIHLSAGLAKSGIRSYLIW